MSNVGELVLWSALPMALLAAILSFAAGWTGRGDLAAVGGRAARATAALLIISVAGLAYALLTVQLRYAYVAAFTGFQDRWPARLAALWSGPAGALLVFTALLGSAAAFNYGRQRTRSGAARTGALATVVLVALLLVATRARPFFQPGTLVLEGLGLPDRMRSLGWQVEWWSVILAATTAAYAFAGFIGQQMSESAAAGSGERAAVRGTAGLLSLALLASTWRAYADTGRLLDWTGLSSVAALLPAWLLALAQLHAPGGPAVPVWAARWRRVTGVALFPAVVGAAVSLIAAAGDVPQARIWGGGLALGIVSGALAGAGGPRRGVESLVQVPGFGPWAFTGGLAALSLAGAAVVWGLIHGTFWTRFGPALLLVTTAGAAAWAVVRPAAGWRRVWPAAAALGLLSWVVAQMASGDAAFGLACGIGAAMAVAFAADLLRLYAARRDLSASDDEPARSLTTARGRRRLAAALAHLGVALALIGFTAGALARVEGRQVEPGEELSLDSAAGRVQLVYLGLSRYQVGMLDKRVASFSLSRGGRAPALAAAALVWDPAARVQSRVPYVSRGLVSDVTVNITGLRGDENIMCSVSSRPLASLVWLGGLLILSSLLILRRTEP